MADERDSRETSRTDFASEREGLRLVKAFMEIKDPAVRGAVIEFVERMSKEASKNSARARELITHALRVFV